jgi:Peptidase A4 family
MPITVGFAAVLMLIVAVGLAPAAGARTAPPAPGLFVPAHRGELLPRSNAAVSSLNWSGYVVAPPSGRTVTSVASTFVVPAVTSGLPGLAALWTGIGGYSSQDLIQAGIGIQDLPGLGSSYYAWYETLPATETPLPSCTGDPNCTVNPGDVISVAITEQAGGKWAIAMTDKGHWSFGTTLTYASTGSSAEWILEAPSLVTVPTILPGLAPSDFGPSDTYALNGAGSASIAAGSPVTVDLLDLGLTAEAIPSALSASGESFSDCTYTATCPLS